MYLRSNSELIGIIALIIIFIGIFSYWLDGLASRVILFAIYLSIVITIVVASYDGKERIIYGMLFLTSLSFLLWRSGYISPYYIEKTLHCRWYLFIQDYAREGHLVFPEKHSYFFSPSLNLYSIWKISGVSLLGSLYVSLIVYCVFVFLVSILVFKAIRRRILTDEKNEKAAVILSSFVALSVMSFSYSERSIIWGGFVPLGLSLMLLMFYFLFDKGLERKKDFMMILLLVIGVTFSSTDGILLMIPFFFLFSLTSKTRNALVFALIPLSYMLFAGYSYLTFLETYVKFAWEGFWEFLIKFITGQTWERIIPWQRTSSMPYGDTVATSIAYLSLLILCLVIVVISTYLLLKDKKKQEMDNNPDMNTCIKSNLICLWLMLMIAGATYIGASIKPEVSFSDIRTIAIVFPTMFLPFQFIHRRLTTTVIRIKPVYVLVIILIIFASLRTGLETGYPKSISDPITVVEDFRMGNKIIYSAGDFIDEHYPEGGIIADYHVSNRLDSWLPTTDYEWRLFDKGDLKEPFARFPNRSILAFHVAGIQYPSTYHSPEAYSAAHSISMTNNRLYDNGGILIVHERGSNLFNKTHMK